MYILGYLCGSAGKESTWNVGNLGSVSGLERSPGEGKGYPLQYSGLENSMDCIVHGVAKSWTWLSDFHYAILCDIYVNPSLRIHLIPHCLESICLFSASVSLFLLCYYHTLFLLDSVIFTPTINYFPLYSGSEDPAFFQTSPSLPQKY